MSIAYGPKKIIRSAAAGSNHVSDDSLDALCIGRSCDIALYNFASVQLIWSGLTGTLNGVLSVEVSDDNINWNPKMDIAATPAAFAITVSGASGNKSISIDNTTERYYRVNWAKTGVTGGTITCILMAKGS